MRGYGGSATPNSRGRNIGTTNNSTGVITALIGGGGPSSAKPRSAMASNGGNAGGAYDPVMGKQKTG